MASEVVRCLAVAERPDIILMDLEMPIVDGWEATRRLKSNPETRDIPVIAFSAHALAGEREKALAAGCDEFETKPIEFDRLVATIRRILACLENRSDSRVVKVNEREKSVQRHHTVLPGRVCTELSRTAV